MRRAFLRWSKKKRKIRFPMLCVEHGSSVRTPDKGKHPNKMHVSKRRNKERKERKRAEGKCMSEVEASPIQDHAHHFCCYMLPLGLPDSPASPPPLQPTHGQVPLNNGSMITMRVPAEGPAGTKRTPRHKATQPRITLHYPGNPTGR